MKWGVIRFPGSLDDLDAMYGLRDVMGQDVTALWHKDESLQRRRMHRVAGRLQLRRPSAMRRDRALLADHEKRREVRRRRRPRHRHL